ncbi:MAG: hypothetical protein C0448_00860 [Sphingobacteriaceae bacterium]|nr:hypothetical protein [Sphingobacteriaceae bacterium]
MNIIDLIKIVFVVWVTQLLVSCDRPRNERITFLEKVHIDLESPSGANRTEGDAHSGKFFSRADSTNIYGVGMIYNIPDSLIAKTIRVKFNAWVRIGDITSDKKYAFSLEDGKGTCMEWVQIDFRDYIEEPNEWVNVIDSVLFPAVFIEMPGMIIKTYSYNSSAKSTLDCDDVELSFYSVVKK